MAQQANDLKRYLGEYIRSITDPDPHGARDKWICPLCGSGTGPNRTGAFEWKEGSEHWHCFKCGKRGDLFDLIGAKENISGYLDRVAFAKQRFGSSPAPAQKPKAKPAVKAKNPGKILQDINEWKSHAGETDYFQMRGFTPEDVQRFGLGYDPKKESIIIPYGEGIAYYQGRFVDAAKHGRRHDFPRAEDAGAEPIFNAAALKGSEPCYICEGPIDALSIMAAGGSAIALGGTNGVKGESNKPSRLETCLKETRPSCPLIPCMDNDKAGKEATEKAKEILERLGLPYCVAELPYKDQEKDPNDILVRDRAELAEAVRNISEKIVRAVAEAKAEERRSIRASGRLERFLQKVTQQTESPVIPTGWGKLDRLLDGGIYPECWIIGAVPSLGKTTFALQMADRIAKSGREVIFFSMEMSAEDLIARSLSRITFEINPKLAKRTREISAGWKWAGYSQAERDLINQAVDVYSEYADNIIFIEGSKDTTVQRIRDIVQEHKTENLGAVFLDYIQIVTPEDPRLSDTKHIENVVSELKRISRDFETAVIAISAFNRENYNAGATMTAFRDSSSIEYGADVLLTMLPEGAQRGKKEDNAAAMDNVKEGPIRSLDVKILKQRNGPTNRGVEFTYHAEYNCFKVK